MVPVTHKLLLIAILVFTCAGDSTAQEWRGIRPLRSTREDVAGKFNQCRDSILSCEFSLADEFVHIEFSGDGTTDAHHCLKELRPYTVLLIEVSPIHPLTLRTLGLRTKNLRTFQIPPSTTGYVADGTGLVFKMDGQTITQLDYIGSREDRSSCPSYYESPEAFVAEIFPMHVPVMPVSCPSSNIRAGETANFSAAVAGQPKLSFLWTVTAGRIRSGQGTRVIGVDTTGLEGQTIVATVRLGRVEASCQVTVTSK